MKVCVVGLGYIGLPTAALMACNGLKVVGVDIRDEIVEKLKLGIVSIDEPGLASIVRDAISNGTLKPTTVCEPADAFVIAVPTPVSHDYVPGKSYKAADMTLVEAAALSVAGVLQRGNLVVLESTSPPGTTTGMVKNILEQNNKAGLKAGHDFYLAYSPERVMPTNIIAEMTNNDRVVGGIDAKSGRRAKDLYAHFVKGKIFETDSTTAEVVKLAENTYRDVNIALANELAKICQTVSADVWDVVRLANHHPRVHLHQPGPGVGGHCIAVDPWFFVEKSPDHATLINAARHVNDAQPEFVVQWIDDLLTAHKVKLTAFLGLTYKADVDDTRESPAIEIVEKFRAMGRSLIVCDPHVEVWKNDKAAANLDDAVAQADALVILVNHREFQKLASMDLTGKLLIDTRRTFKDAAPPKGAEYHLLGSAARPTGANL